MAEFCAFVLTVLGYARTHWNEAISGRWWYGTIGIIFNLGHLKLISPTVGLVGDFTYLFTCYFLVEVQGQTTARCQTKLVA